MSFELDFASYFVSPERSFSEIMDDLFLLWIGDGTEKTFDEFIAV